MFGNYNNYGNSSFWLDNNSDVDVLTGLKRESGKDLVQLAAYKRAIANFVQIVTGKSIPVKFQGKESYTYGNPSTGAQNTYGDPSGTDASAAALAYGGKDNTQYQIRLNFAKQKCESIKIQITEVEGSNSKGNAESAGPGFTLSNLSFIVGTKEGDFKIKQSRVFTTGTNS